jgi:hypothetical protein
VTKTPSRSMTKDAVRLRHQRIAGTYIETGGDLAATAAKHHVSVDTVERVRAQAGLRERFWLAAETEQMTIAHSIGVLRDAHAAELTLVTPKGEVITGLPDHKTRIAAARNFLGVASTLERLGEPEPLAPPAAPTRALTVRELLALPGDQLNRVVMESTRVLIEPMPDPIAQFAEIAESDPIETHMAVDTDPD